MRRATTAALVALVWGVAAGVPPARAAGPIDTYPVEQTTYFTQNTQRSVTDPATGQYSFNEGMYGVARRAVQRYPDHYLTPNVDIRREAQVAIDGATHMRPDLPYTHFGDAGNPELMPDWDHDGVFGDSGGTNINDVGDFDADTDEVLDTAYFLFPCYTAADQWEVHHRLASGACDVSDAGGTYKLGVATEQKVIDARGLVLDATLWLPMEAFSGSGCPAYGSAAYGRRTSWLSCVTPANLVSTGAIPGVVFANGLASRQEHYSWFAMRMVDEGYVVLTYDPAGQGQSEGTFGDTLGLTDPNRPACQFAGACRDVQDMVRWFVGRPITAVPDRGLRLVPRGNPANNKPNPALSTLDLSRVALAGNSMGAIATLSYLDYLGAGAGADGRPLPGLIAAISMSGAAQTRAVVPIMFQTSDGDGSPAFLIPALLGIDLGSNGEGIGYKLIKQRYDSLRGSHGPGALSLIVLEGGVHTDHVDVPYSTRTNWANALAADYAADWINCYARGEVAACAGAGSARPHLSRVFASEQDPDGPAGPSASHCITVPDEASLSQEPQDFLSALQGHPVYDCTR